MDSIREKLLPLRLYRMDGSSRVEAELSAVAEGLDLVYQALENLTQEAFVPTAQGVGLAMLERTFGSERTDLPLELRREMLLYRGAVTVNDNTKQSVERALLSVGLRAQLWESPREQKLYVICYEVLDQKMTRYRLKESALRFLPAHLEIIFDFGKVTWDYLHKTEKTFLKLAELEYTWEQIRELE
ncbi:hypothetical protein [Faecalispora anaeroviscerum]|uniref:hypothetical protein n=1 Tax=Faecalispora anaeroviscerum TaxID=2991836 RepID=UPI0024BA6D42|nr:hypothetical protein [Faecalispora anaeroviscerum]